MRPDDVKTARTAFTLIEVLVVVAIIALLVAILIPSLARVREQARVTKCLSNMSNLPKAVLSFAQEHKGYAQLIGEPVEWQTLDPSYTRYVYQTGAWTGTAPDPLATGKTANRWLKPWPIAYAPQLGMPSLKRMEQYFERGTTAQSLDYYREKFGAVDLFVCPSDKIMVHNVWSPFIPSPPAIFGIMSYAANEDVFGVTGAQPGHVAANAMKDLEGQPWKDGSAAQTTGLGGPHAKRLEGKLDNIVQPSTVVLFCDGGNEDNPENPALLITNDASINGPYLENYEKAYGRLPHVRHTDKGGLAAAFADGSGLYVKPLEWVNLGGKRYVKRYAPRARVSPHFVGQLRPNQP